MTLCKKIRIYFALFTIVSLIDRVFRAQFKEKKINEWAGIRVKLSDYDRNIDG